MVVCTNYFLDSATASYYVLKMIYCEVLITTLQALQQDIDKRKMFLRYLVFRKILLKVCRKMGTTVFHALHVCLLQPTLDGLPLGTDGSMMNDTYLP